MVHKKLHALEKIGTEAHVSSIGMISTVLRGRLTCASSRSSSRRRKEINGCALAREQDSEQDSRYRESCSEKRHFGPVRELRLRRRSLQKNNCALSSSHQGPAPCSRWLLLREFAVESQKIRMTGAKQQ